MMWESHLLWNWEESHKGVSDKLHLGCHHWGTDWCLMLPGHLLHKAPFQTYENSEECVKTQHTWVSCSAFHHSFMRRRLQFSESLCWLQWRVPRVACGVESTVAPGSAGLGSPFPCVGLGSQMWRAAQMQDRLMDLLPQQIILQQRNALSRKIKSLFFQKKRLYIFK